MVSEPIVWESIVLELTIIGPGKIRDTVSSTSPKKFNFRDIILKVKTRIKTIVKKRKPVRTICPVQNRVFVLVQNRVLCLCSDTCVA